MHPRHRDRDRERLLVLEHLPASLPGERPRGDDGDLCYEEHGPCDDRLAQVDAHAHGGRYVLALDKHRVPASRASVRRLAVVLESELVRDLDRLDEKQVLAGLGAGRATATTLPVRNDGAQLAGRLLLIALHRLAGGHARCDQSAELYHLRAREFEGVEVRKKNLKEMEWILHGYIHG